MRTSTADSNLAHPFAVVKSQSNTQLLLFPDSVIHHSSPLRLRLKGNREEIWRGTSYYGVSSSKCILPRELLIKRYDYVRDCLKFVLGLTKQEVKVTLKLLKFHVYYGSVFPTASQLAGEYNLTPQMVSWRETEGLGPVLRRGEIGRATVWRTIALLQRRGLITIINRYLTPWRRQISNLYVIHELLMVIAEYLAKHLAQFWPPYFIPYFNMTWAEWEKFINREQLELPLPSQLGL